MRVCPGCRAVYDKNATSCESDGLPLIEVSRTFAERHDELSQPTLRGALDPGMMVGDYKIERLIAEGGMGSVYSAVHPVISKRVAVKVLSGGYAKDPKSVSRFVMEARSVNEIGHHNIIDIYSIGELDDGRNYLVMELLDGIELHEVLGHVRRFEPGQLLPLFEQLCDALSAAHDKGFIHRDLKPDNVIILRRPPHPFVKILDFGIAKLRSMGQQGEGTEVGTVLGTPEYMAPEQVRGDDIDHRVDVYSLGVLLYELLSGRKPFHHENPLKVLTMQLRNAPTPLSSLIEVDPRLEHLIMRTLSKTPDDRPSSVMDLLASLRKLITTTKPWPKISELGAQEPTPAPDRHAHRTAVPAPVAIEGEVTDLLVGDEVTATQRDVTKPLPTHVDLEDAPTSLDATPFAGADTSEVSPDTDQFRDGAGTDTLVRREQPKRPPTTGSLLVDRPMHEEDIDPEPPTQVDFRIEDARRDRQAIHAKRTEQVIEHRPPDVLDANAGDGPTTMLAAEIVDRADHRDLADRVVPSEQIIKGGARQHRGPAEHRVPRTEASSQPLRKIAASHELAVPDIKPRRPSKRSARRQTEDDDPLQWLQPRYVVPTLVVCLIISLLIAFL